MRSRAHALLDSPIGPIAMVAAGGVLAGLYLDARRHPVAEELLGDRDDSVLPEAARQLAEYFAGERTVFEVPLALTGTPFQRAVWAALQEIPYGRTTTYGEVADRSGRPRAARAVGLANGRNPISLIVPCHRVVGASGKPIGSGSGLDRKLHLLELERGNAAHSPAAVIRPGATAPSSRPKSRNAMS